MTVKYFSKSNIISLSLLIVLTFSVPAFTGCGGEEKTTATIAPATEPSSAVTTQVNTNPPATESTIPATSETGTNQSVLDEQKLKHILQDSLEAVIATEKYRVVLSMSGEITTSETFGSITMSIDAEAAFDKSKDEMQMSLDIAVETGISQDEESVGMEIYRTLDYVYLKMDSAGQSTPWIKMKPTPEVIEATNANIMDEELEAMESPVEVEYIRDENIEGKDYYVIKFTPNSDYLKDYARDNLDEYDDIDWKKVTDIREIYKEISYVVWIEKDTKYLYRMDERSVVEITSDFLLTPGTDSSSIKTVTEGYISFHDYNSEFSINIPSEALNAEEFSPDIFFPET